MTELSRLVISMAAPLMFLLPGMAVAASIPRVWSSSRSIRAAWAWILGAAWVGVGSFAASYWFRVPLRRGSFFVLAAVPVVSWVVVAAASARSPALGARSARPERRAYRPAWLLLFCVIPMAFVLLLEGATAPTVDYDGRMTWGVTAKFIRIEGTVTPSALTDPKCYVSHPQYPPLVPLLRVAIEESLGLPWDSRCTRPLYSYFFFSFLLILFDGVRRVAGRRAAIVGTVAAALVFPLTFEPNGGPAGTYSDFPLAVFFGGALLLGLVSHKQEGAAIASGLLFSAVVLTKNEGLPIALLVSVALVVRAVRIALRMKGRRWARIPLGMAPILCVVGSACMLVGWRSHIPNRFDEAYASSLMKLDSVAVPVRRLLEAIPAVMVESAKIKGWGPCLAVIAALALLHPRSVLKPATRAMVLPVLAPLLVGLAAYAIPGWVVRELVEVTWHRFLIQSALPILTVGAILAKPFIPMRRLNARSVMGGEG